MKPNNPFLISGYHSPEFFCDREQETAKILDALSNGRNVTLIAPRRMGKTGLIRHAFYHLKEQQPEIVTLYMDIFSTQSLGDFVRLFANTVLGKLDSAPQKALSRISQFIRSCRPVFTFDEITGVPKVTIDVAPAEEENTLKEIFDYLASSEKRCYIAIDEFQQIVRYEDETIEAIIRTYVQRCTNAHFIFSGSQRHLMNEMFTSPARPFYQSVAIINLQPLALDVYTDFCVSKFEQAGKYIERDVVRILYERFDAVTSYMHRILNVLFSKTNKGEICNAIMVDEAIDLIIRLSFDTYESLFYQMPEKQRMLFLAIAREGRVKEITGGTFVRKHKLISSSSVNSALKGLLEKDFVTMDKNMYCVYDHFFVLWLKFKGII